MTFSPGIQLIDLKTGKLTQQGILLLQEINILPVYTVGTLPSPATPAQLIYVTDGTSNKRMAVSDGTNWRFPDGNIVS